MLIIKQKSNETALADLLVPDQPDFLLIIPFCVQNALLRDLFEQQVDVFPSFRRNLKILQLVRVGKLLRLLRERSPQVVLVAHHYLYSLVCLLLEDLRPLLHLVHTLLLVQRKHQQNNRSLPVIHLRYRIVLLLPSRIPQLHLHRIPINHLLLPKIHRAYRRRTIGRIRPTRITH